jgi:hypothetical protein
MYEYNLWSSPSRGLATSIRPSVSVPYIQISCSAFRESTAWVSCLSPKFQIYVYKIETGNASHAISHLCIISLLIYICKHKYTHVACTGFLRTPRKWWQKVTKLQDNSTTFDLINYIYWPSIRISILLSPPAPICLMNLFIERSLSDILMHIRRPLILW